MTYSLDTNVFVSVLRGSTVARARLNRLERPYLAISSVALFELVVGAYAGRRTSEQLQRTRELLRGVTVAELSESDAVAAAHLGTALTAQGQEIGAFDVLIAGQALNRGWVIITLNTKHFNRVPGLQVIDWAQAGTPPYDA